MGRFKMRVSCFKFGLLTSLVLMASLLVAFYQNQSRPQLIWGKQWGTKAGDFLSDIASDGQGNIYISGMTYGSLFGQNQGEIDIFILKLDSNGQVIWSRQLGTARDDGTAKIAVDRQANIYVLSETERDWFGKSSGREDIVVLKLSANGELLWGKRFGTNDQDFGTDIAVDRQGYVYITGSVRGSLFAEYQRGELGEGEEEGFLAKLDPDGNLVWGKQFKDDIPEAIAVDSQGNIYVSGTAYDYVNNTIVALLAKFTSNGTLVWREVLPANVDEGFLSISVNRNGDVCVAGEVIVYLDENKLVSVSDAFLAKYDGTNGQRLWSKRLKSQEQGDISESFKDVRVDEQGNIYVVGFAEGSLFGNHLGDSDVVLSKFDSEGNMIWSKQWGSVKGEVGESIALDGAGNIYVAGQTQGDLYGTNEGGMDIFVVKFRQ